MSSNEALANEIVSFDSKVNAYRTTPPELAVIVDDSASPIIYICKAPIGSSTSLAVWQVAKLDTTSGLVKKWSDGDSKFDNVYDNRASLTYN
jgi:hypothetical protein